MIRVFIDGSEGTTGLRIHDRLPGRADIELLTIDPALRKDPDARRELLNSADIAFLCLPDAAAREAVAMVENPHTHILDTSTAHRTAAGWAYGFPELTAGHRTAVQGGTRIAVPGCHASGYLAAVRPLVEAGLLCPDAALCCTSLTGYSGGGRKMIAEYEAAERPAALDAPRIYGLTQQHKHLPEMRLQSGLTTAPVFLPIVADFYSGMLVSVPLPQGVLTRALSPEANGVARFPVQLLESALLFALFFLLAALFRRGALRAKLLALYLAVYAVLRFLLEFLRGDAIRGVYFGLSTSQWISLAILLALGVAALARACARRRARASA